MSGDHFLDVGGRLLPSWLLFEQVQLLRFLQLSRRQEPEWSQHLLWQLHELLQHGLLGSQFDAVLPLAQLLLLPMQTDMIINLAVGTTTRYTDHIYALLGFVAVSHPLQPWMQL